MSKPIKNIIPFPLWFILRLAFLNLFIFVLVYAIGIGRNTFEPPSEVGVRFPLSMYVTALFLTNLVYIIGNLFEVVHSKLWKKKVDYFEMEKPFFKAAIVMAGIVCVTGIIIYFNWYFS